MKKYEKISSPQGKRGSRVGTLPTQGSGLKPGASKVKKLAHIFSA
jgi:hypothetical protein